MSSSSIDAADRPPNSNPMQYTLNSRMIIGALAVLLVVILVILVLHAYAKWFWRWGPGSRRRRRSASWRRRNRLDFTGQEPHNMNRAVGLDKCIVDALPIFTYKLPSTAEEPLLECAVCLCEFVDDEKGRRLPACKHSFHTDCIDMWFHSHITCPLCRTVVTSASGENLSKTQEEQRASSESSALPLPLLANGSDSNAYYASSIDIALPPAVLYPNNVLFWGDHNQVSSQLSSPGLATGGSSSTRSLPQIAIDISRRTDCLSRRTESLGTARCLSLSLSRSPSVDMDESPSQAQKSPVNRMSIRRLLSWDRGRSRTRISPSVGLDLSHPRYDERQAA